MNILEALKKYIRANGGSSRANNISEAVKDLDSIPKISDSVLVKSSTEGSDKIFAITVNDSGTISATEVV